MATSVRSYAPRALAAAGAAMLAGVALIAAAALQPAVADFSSACTSYDRQVTDGGQSISIAPGEVVLITGTDFVAGIDALPAGATLCVAAGARLAPGYMNNAAGSLYVASGASLALPGVSVSTGFHLELEGSGTIAGINMNGSGSLYVAPSGDLVIASGFSPSAGTIVNDGSLEIQGETNLNSSAVLDNRMTLLVDGTLTVNGGFENRGLVHAESIILNSTASFYNGCGLQSDGDLVNDSPEAVNVGLVVAGGAWTNNGTWEQPGVGALQAASMVDDGSVAGFGRYVFTGATSVQGSFVGDASEQPILVQTAAPSGSTFDVETGTIANITRVPSIVIDPGDFPSADCAIAPTPSADLVVSKTGPASVEPGGSVSYVITVSNAGPDAAENVVITDRLPSELASPSSSDGGTIDPAASTITWQLGTLAAGAEVNLTVTGIAPTPPAGGTAVLEDVVSGSASTNDPDPSTNDGSGPTARVVTLVVDTTPANDPPVADDQAITVPTGSWVVGVVTASDPNPDQSLRFVLENPPAFGRVIVLPSGAFAYQAPDDYTGMSGFTFRACDNATPPLCDSGTVTITVTPVAVDDDAETTEATAVDIPISRNDSLGAVLDTVPVVAPANGDVVLDPAGGARYTPEPGFLGVDSFQYRMCSPSVPSLCDIATVTVTVIAVNHPPVVDPLALVTVTGVPVAGSVTADDPDGDVVTVVAGVPPRTGTASLTGGETVTYTPVRGFVGYDAGTVFVCDDGTPQLCATGPVTATVYPLAADDSAETAVGQAVDVPVLGNDRGDVDPPAVVAAPANGSVVAAGDALRYTPAADFVGTDEFAYEICGANAPALCATATVTIVVTAGPAPGPDPDGGGGGGLADSGVRVAGPLTAAAMLLGCGALPLLLRRRGSRARSSA